MNRRLRITLLAAAATLLVLVAGMLVLAFVMLRPERFTRTLRASARDAGLVLALTSPAHPTLWPRPGVRLEGLQLFVKGRSYPLLLADSGNIVVPWRTVLEGSTAITTLELDAPRLDLGQLQRALATLPASNGSAPRLPRIDTGVTIRRGALVRGDKLLLQDIDLHTGALMPGRRFIVDAQAKTPGGRQGLLKLQFTPRKQADGSLVLDALQLDLRTGRHARLRLAGQARWDGGTKLSLALAGHMHTDGNDDYSVTVRSQPAAAGTLHLVIRGPAAHADLQLSPGDLYAWWQRMAGTYAPGPLPPPPLQGSLEAKAFDLGSLRVRGLKLQSTPARPATTASAPSPARTTGK